MATDSSLAVEANKRSFTCSLKRKRPTQIEIPNVLQEIKIDKLGMWSSATQNEAVCVGGDGYGVCSVKGKKKLMEDSYKIVSGSPGKSFKGFFGVYDGHGGRKAAEFVADNLHTNVLEMMENCDSAAAKEEAVKSGYLKTDQKFLDLGVGSGACCVTIVIEGKNVIISNAGDCRAVLCRGGVAEALTKDHRAENEDERKRIEDKGGYVEMHRGAWRVHGVLSVSRSIGDAHLKDWVVAEPDTKILKLSPDMEFLVLASDGLWDKVGNQEAVDTVMRLCHPEKKQETVTNRCSDNADDFGHVNASPSSKIRRISLIKQRKAAQRSPICNNDENESPRPFKSRRVSLLKKPNTDTNTMIEESVNQETRCSEKRSSNAVGACKELVDLAARRGSFDDITVMVIDLDHFRS